MTFTITEVGKVSRNNFLIEETFYNVNYANFVERFEDADHEVSEMLREFVERFTALMSETDKMSVSFFHKTSNCYTICSKRRFYARVVGKIFFQGCSIISIYNRLRFELFGSKSSNCQNTNRFRQA